MTPRRVHLAGSASKSAPAKQVAYAHDLVRGFAHAHLLSGGSVLTQIGDEPRSETDSRLAITWDWTVIGEVASLVEAGTVRPRGATGAVLAVAASEKGIAKIPEDRRSTWDALLAARSSWMSFHRTGAPER